MKDPRGSIAVGCIFWPIAIAGLVLCVLSLVVSPVVEPVLSARADNAAARRAKEQAEQAEAEASLVVAQAQAEILKMLSEAGVNAIETDRRHAHPLVWLEETLVKVLLILCIPLSLILVTLTVIWYRDPETAHCIIVALASLRPRRPPKADGEYRDSVSADAGEIVNP